MRSRKYRVMTTLERGSNRLIRLALRAGVAPRAFALLETTGRCTGLARHTPVGTAWTATPSGLSPRTGHKPTTSATCKPTAGYGSRPTAHGAPDSDRAPRR